MQEYSNIKGKKGFKVKKRKKMVEKPTTTAKCVANELVNDYINNNCYYNVSAQKAPPVRKNARGSITFLIARHVALNK